MKKINKIIGIDASNLIYGGGRTHIIEILDALNLHFLGFEKIIIWGSENTLSLIPNYFWLEKKIVHKLNKGIFVRTMWQTFSLSQLAKSENCDILFVPSGIFLGNFRPFVTMSRNLIPFENNELFRYGFSLTTFRLLILRFVQILTFQRANGIIFLTDYAKKVISKYINEVVDKCIVIPHGVSDRFKPLNYSLKPGTFSFEKPLIVSYVSHIEIYKHQWKVIESLSNLRIIGIPIILNLVGTKGTPNAVNLFKKAIKKYDPNLQWVKYFGSVEYSKLNIIYQETDIAIFASSCENMPNTLLELMASGLPIACSNKGPMPDILKEYGLYFDPENPSDISKQIYQYYINPVLRKTNGNKSRIEADKYSWAICANSTFSYLDDVLNRYKNIY